jgi:hypothetical protein
VFVHVGKVDPTPHTSSFNMGYLVSPYPYPNGAGGPIPVSMVSLFFDILTQLFLKQNATSFSFFMILFKANKKNLFTSALYLLSDNSSLSFSTAFLH